jgi:hypothetical protein
VNSKQDFLYRFEHTWPAMSYKLNGTVFVYNPEDKKHTEELNLWYIEYFSLCNYSFLLGIITLSKNQIYQKNVVYLSLQKRVKMKKEVELVVMKQDYVRFFHYY